MKLKTPNYPLLGFTLAEVLVSVAIIGILFISISAFLTKFLETKIQASEYLKVQDETFIHVQMLESLVKNAKNVFSYGFDLINKEHLYDVLIVENNISKEAPFVFIKPFEKKIKAPDYSILKLDELIAANRNKEQEYFMGISSLYFWSDISYLNNAGKRIIYPDPYSGKIKVFDITTPKGDFIEYAKKLDFGNPPNERDFVMPTGIERISPTEFFISDRSDHTIWKIDIIDYKDDKIIAKKERVLGVSYLPGSLKCDEAEKEIKAIKGECKGILLNQPNGLLYNDGVLYIADSGNHRILKYEIASKNVNELIYNPNYESGESSDGTNSANFYMNTPVDIAMDNKKNLYISDSFNHRILQYKNDSKVNIFSGTGTKGFSGDFGIAKLAQMAYPTGIYFNNNSLYVSDSGNNVLRIINFEDDRISTFIGDSHQLNIQKDLPSTLVSQGVEEFDANFGHMKVSQKNPLPSSLEIDTVLQNRGEKIEEAKRFFYLNEAGFYYNTGIFVNPYSDVFIIDSLNNQIKLAAISEAIFEPPLPVPHMQVEFRDLQKYHMQYRIFTIVRSEDYGNYNFLNHAMTSENDYISPYPLKHMYFKVHGVTDKIVMCNISIGGLGDKELASNNFQFSISLRNQVEVNQ